MTHDSPGGNGCPSSGFIMAAVGCSSCTAVTEFSACSKVALTDFFNQVAPTCLNNGNILFLFLFLFLLSFLFYPLLFFILL